MDRRRCLAEGHFCDGCPDRRPCVFWWFGSSWSLRTLFGIWDFWQLGFGLDPLQLPSHVPTIVHHEEVLPPTSLKLGSEHTDVSYPQQYWHKSISVSKGVVQMIQLATSSKRAKEWSLTVNELRARSSDEIWKWPRSLIPRRIKHKSMQQSIGLLELQNGYSTITWWARTAHN
jgi:hypothetical protein